MRKPERIVHLGLGAFFRAHQAWYTQHAKDAADWGIVAYTGRGPKAAQELNAQDCRYTLVTRSESGDEFEVIDSVVRAQAADDVEDLKTTLAKPEIALVTLTITEAGYQVSEQALESSALGRLALGLDARRLANGEPIALVPCDNMPANGEVLKAALLKLSTSIGAELTRYLQDSVSFVSTSIDRITPKTQPEDIELVLNQTGFSDQAVVVTEPFRDWILQGDFPLGRPAWESAGAKFVEDIEQFENRKLWLLNGAHTLMSFVGRILGHETVDQAIQDPAVLELVNAFWDEAQNHLTHEALEVPSYRAALIERFTNPRIGYRLEQIAQEGITKLGVRIAPVALLELKAGRLPKGAISAISGFVCWVLSNQEVSDSREAEIHAAIESSDPVAALISLVDKELLNFPVLVGQIREKVLEITV